MSPAEQRALALGAELHKLNTIRATRARMAASATNRGPALWAWLMNTARLDQSRRRLRRQLFDALLECPGLHTAEHERPRAWPWPSPRHAAPLDWGGPDA